MRPINACYFYYLKRDLKVAKTQFILIDKLKLFN